MSTGKRARVGAVEVHSSSGIVAVTMDRPSVYNALNDEMVAGLEYALQMALDTDAHLFVLRGSGKNFCSGADLKYVSALIGDIDSGLLPYIEKLRAICTALAEGPFVSLAVVEGYALAGGYELLTACDLAVATTSAGIGDRHLEYALAPGLGASVYIGRHMSAKRARYLAFTGEIISGQQAAEWGLVSHCWDTAEFDAKVESLVERLLTRSPASLRSYKQMLVTSEREDFRTALKLEAEAFEKYQRSHADAREGVLRFSSSRSNASEK
jgi:enoyl-CoA hydratase/carnithine racemase